jgi:hypothetical protein
LLLVAAAATVAPAPSTANAAYFSGSYPSKILGFITKVEQQKQ